MVAFSFFGLSHLKGLHSDGLEESPVTSDFGHVSFGDFESCLSLCVETEIPR
jgi:hypothetical protein